MKDSRATVYSTREPKIFARVADKNVCWKSMPFGLAVSRRSKAMDYGSSRGKELAAAMASKQILTVRRISLCKTVRDVSLILQQSFFSTKFFSSFNCSKLLRGTVVEKIATFSPIMGVQLEGLF